MTPALLVHVAGGGVAIVAGAVALTVRTGFRLHRASGGVFLAAMFAMAGAATLLALTLPDWANLPGGLFAVYLVGTGWAALTRNSAMSRLVEQTGLALGGGATATALLLAFQAKASATGLVGGKGAPLFLIVAGLCAFAVMLDLRMLRLADLPHRARMRRHIWRMCTALFLGTGSFFLGQQKVMPLWMQGSPLLCVLALAPLIVMAIWLFLSRAGNKRGRGPVWTSEARLVPGEVRWTTAIGTTAPRKG